MILTVHFVRGDGVCSGAAHSGYSHPVDGADAVGMGVVPGLLQSVLCDFRDRIVAAAKRTNLGCVASRAPGAVLRLRICDHCFISDLCAGNGCDRLSHVELDVPRAHHIRTVPFYEASGLRVQSGELVAGFAAFSFDAGSEGGGDSYFKYDCYHFNLLYKG